MEEQAEKFSYIQHEAFLSFVPSKTVLIRPKEQNWSSQLLLIEGQKLISLILLILQ